MLSKKVERLAPYTAGEQPKEKKYIKLNTNENPYPPSQKIKSLLCGFDYGTLKLYPDPDARALKKEIALFENVGEENIFLGNGSDEVLAFAFYALFDSNIAFADITYSFYPSYCRLFDVSYNTIPLKEDFSIDENDYISKGYGGIVIANPNAPTSLTLENDKIEKIVATNKCNVLIDEAYIDFANVLSGAGLTKKYNNVLIVKTFSKSYSLAGQRIGYAVGSVELIRALESVKNSFNSYPLDTLSQSIALAAFSDREYHNECCQKVILTRDNTIKELKRMGAVVLPSQTNFLFVKIGNDGKALFEYLKDRSILTRHFDKPRIREYIRVSVGDDEQMRAFLEAMKEYKNN